MTESLPEVGAVTVLDFVRRRESWADFYSGSSTEVNRGDWSLHVDTERKSVDFEMGGNSFRDDRVCAAGVNCGPDCDAPGFVVNGTQGSPDGGSLELAWIVGLLRSRGLRLRGGHECNA